MSAYRGKDRLEQHRCLLRSEGQAARRSRLRPARGPEARAGARVPPPGRSPAEELAEDALRWREQGFTALRFGPLAAFDDHSLSHWDPQRSIVQTIAATESLRDAVGVEVDLILDASSLRTRLARRTATSCRLPVGGSVSSSIEAEARRRPSRDAPLPQRYWPDGSIGDY
jgi:hypothetical protein